jgi:hypothetical protein
MRKTSHGNTFGILVPNVLKPCRGFLFLSVLKSYYFLEKHIKKPPFTKDGKIKTA